jgi:RNA polymerase sigma-70 factor, ECF subfamily
MFFRGAKVRTEVGSLGGRLIGPSFYVGPLPVGLSPIVIPDQETELFGHQVVLGEVANRMFGVSRHLQHGNSEQNILSEGSMVQIDSFIVVRANGISRNIRRLLSIFEESTREPSQDASFLIESIHAFELYAREHEKLFFMLAYHVVQNTHIAQDIVQDSLEKAYKKLQVYPIDKLKTLKMKAWLCRIVANTALNYKKRENKLSSLDLDDWLLQKEGYRYEQPEVALLRKEIEALLRLTLGALPKQQKDIVILRFWRGYKLEEIAITLHCPIGTVKCYLHRALSFMREMLRRSGINATDVDILAEYGLEFLL